jgi:hypothetical protein
MATFREVVGNATFINGPPIENPTQTPLHLSSDSQLLFPFMNFTCSGTMTRLTFLGWLSDSSEQFNVTRLTSLPYFSLWRPRQDQYFEEAEQIGSDSLTQLYRINATYQLVEVTLSTDIQFNPSDVLGVTSISQPRRSDSTFASGISMTILSESRDYDKTLRCDYIGHATGQSVCVQCSEALNSSPYIAIETGEM